MGHPIDDWLAARVRELRAERDLTQADLAFAAQQLGLRWTRGTVSAIENGRRRVMADEWLLLPRVFNDAVEFAGLIGVPRLLGDDLLPPCYPPL